jgi:rhodanese-related sulfurtransferase
MMRNSLTAILLVFSLGACNGQQNSPMSESSTASQIEPKSSALIDSDSFERKLPEPGVQLIDVRTPGEYAAGYIGNATLLDISEYESFKTAIAELDKSKPVMVYCAAGGRSGQAAAYLSDQGFREVYDLKGGINSWRSAGKNITINK